MSCLGQSLVGSLLFSPGSWCVQGFVCALHESVSPVLWKFCSKMEQTKQNRAVTPQETDPDLPVSVQEPPAQAQVGGGAAELGAPSVAVRIWDLLKEAPLSPLPPPYFGLRSNYRGGTQPSNRILDLTFTEHGPTPSEQDPVSPTVSISYQEASISLLSLLIRGQTE